MKKVLQKISLIILIFIVLVAQKNIVYGTAALIKVYNIEIHLKNINTEEYVIELVSGETANIQNTQDGNKDGIHTFSIASTKDPTYLEEFWFRIKYDNGEIKDFEKFKLNNLTDIDDITNDFSYSYKYDVTINLLPKSVVIVIAVAIGVAVLVFGIIKLKNHKRRIK